MLEIKNIDKPIWLEFLITKKITNPFQKHLDYPASNKTCKYNKWGWQFGILQSKKGEYDYRNIGKNHHYALIGFDTNNIFY